MVLDFANEAKDIKEGFDPYYEKTILSESTDPNLLYQFQRKLLSYHVFTEDDVNAFAAIYFSDTGTQDQLYQRLNPIADRCEELDSEEKHDLKTLLQKYTRLYSFVSQIIPFRDTDLEKLHQFCRYLWRLIPGKPIELPREIQQNIDMESYRVGPSRDAGIKLKRGTGRLKPPVVSPEGWQIDEEMEPLSQIIADLNDRFGIELTDDDPIPVRRALPKLAADTPLDCSVSWRRWLRCSGSPILRCRHSLEPGGFCIRQRLPCAACRARLGARPRIERPVGSIRAAVGLSQHVVRSVGWLAAYLPFPRPVGPAVPPGPPPNTLPTGPDAAPASRTWATRHSPNRSCSTLTLGPPTSPRRISTSTATSIWPF